MKLYWKYWMPFLVITVAFAGGAAAKSLYVNSDLNQNSPIAAYDIDGTTGCLTFQASSAKTRYGGAGLTIDTDSETLFVTFESSGLLDVVDAADLSVLSHVNAPGASNLAGIVVDQKRSRVYAVDRGVGSLYAYDWDSTGHVLNLVGTGATELSSVQDQITAYGLALDEENDWLYVADLRSSMVRVYNAAADDWLPVDKYAITQPPMAVAVDTVGQYLYTGNAHIAAGCTGELVQTDLTKVSPEKIVNIRNLRGAVGSDCVVGIAVDPLTRWVYVTTGNLSAGGSDRILVFDDQTLTLQCATADIGNPTGITIPGKEVSFNPLALSKDDGLSDSGCVSAGGTIDYNICYENGNEDGTVTEVTLIDTLPSKVAFTSAPSGTYDATAHTVTWNVGSLTANGSQQCTTVSVTVQPGADPLLELVNSVVIEGTFPDDRQIKTTYNEETTVCDNAPPTAVCMDVTVSADVSCTADASVNGGSYDSDGQGDIASIVQYPSGPYLLYDTAVTLTIADVSGATDACTATVTVTDTTPPTQDTADPICLWPPNHKYYCEEVSAFKPTGTDNCGIDLVAGVSLISCDSDQPDNDIGDGNFINDCFVPLDEELERICFRAERQGGVLSGRRYTAFFEAQDASGNTATWSRVVFIPHDKKGKPPGVSCIRAKERIGKQNGKAKNGSGRQGGGRRKRDDKQKDKDNGGGNRHHLLRA